MKKYLFLLYLTIFVFSGCCKDDFVSGYCVIYYENIENLKIDTQGGDDSVVVEDLTTAGIISVRIDLGTGDDTYESIQARTTSFTVYGGLGDDTFIIDSSANDLYDGGDGIDTISYATLTGDTGVNIDLSVGRVSDDGYGSTDILCEFQNITGSENNDIITGDDRVNVIHGIGGNYIINSFGNDELLKGGYSVYTLYGIYG